ncbi:MAG: LysM peptidoglycan-binding domain-containing protein, partial [Acidobacteria bacterium]|nr:LysM peptidoglycan-binding domain-containing protein [Acidobacteriota bacterium]
QDPASLEPPPRPGDQVGWYVVQEGDTLRGITLRTLGVVDLWRENHRLNPRIQDPDLLRIGQRIRIITSRPPAAREAHVTLVSRVVKTQRFPTHQEEDATVGDRLRERDGIRTAENSSSELTFDAQRRLFVGERSLIFLERVDSTLRGVQRDSIEIRRGEAEVVARPSRTTDSEIEILVGGTTARPQPGAAGVAQTRARRPEAGGAQVMVYGGSSQVEAAGAMVEVPRGMGTAVPEGGPPAPPEKLLPAPRTEAPAIGRRFSYANPLFVWKAVPEAVSYTVEICSDPACSALILHETGVEDTTWSPDGLPVGDLYWRVTAVSASGLDGYPSVPRALGIDSERLDQAPPVVALALDGPGVATENTAELGPGAMLRLEAFDDAAGVAIVRYRWDGGAWSEWQGGTLAVPAGNGPFTLEVEAEDGRGTLAPTWSASVRRSADRPEPPTPRWSP